jgi:hypothetical protein
MLLTSLHVKSFAPAAFISTPTLIILVTHLLIKMTAGAELTPHIFTTMMQSPVQATQALISSTICQLLLPPWLGEWLNTLATQMADLQCINGETHEEVITIRGLLRDLLQNLTATFDKFTACTAHIVKLTTHVPIAMVELREAAHYDNATIGNISKHVTDLDSGHTSHPSSGRLVGTTAVH